MTPSDSRAASAALDAVRLAFPSLSDAEIDRSIERLLQAGFAIIPIHPQPQVLSSMLQRHDLHPASPCTRLMAHLHEEVVGLGIFNRPTV